MKSGGCLSGKNFAIVGIDPGATFGIAAVDLSGKKLMLHSTMGGFSDAARFIEAHCTPALVACDTNPAPEAALRLASYFSCRLFVPRESIRESEKNAIARGAGTHDAHQRDAYCSAVHAYRLHANKLRQIDALDGLTSDEKGRVKHMLLRGYRVQDAFLLLREPETVEEKPEAKKAVQMKTATPEELRLRLESLARENSNLRLALSRLEEEKGALSQRLRLLENGVRQNLMREGEYRKLRYQLQQSLSRLGQRKEKPQKRGRQEESRQQHEAARHAQLQESHQGQQKQGKQPEKAQQAGEDGEQINNFGEPNVDLKRLVEEYRKGRKF